MHLPLMKNIVLLLVISLAALSCKKDPDEPASTANFNITGIHDADLTATSDASASFTISILPNSGAKDTVGLSAGDLPAGVSADFVPRSGITPFTSRVTFRYNFSGTGGTYPVTITGNGHSGSKSYKLNLILDYYRGWRLGDSTYYKTSLTKDPGDAIHYPNIKVLAVPSGQLTISFGIGKYLPTANKTYKITPTSGTTDDIQIAIYDNPIIYSATGVGSPTGTFTFDTLGKFTFKCKGVEMTNGTQKKLLDCSFSE